jgi:surfactin synthase thioesterase subunit
MTAPWLRPPRSDARLLLFCFPHAGGGSADHRPWATLLPADIDVVPVLPPGREALLREPPRRRMADLVPFLADAIAPYTARPYALLGHSMGAWVAFELARELRRRGRSPARHLFACARRAPHVPGDGVRLADLPEQELLDTLGRRYGAIPKVLLENRDILRMFLPTLRADLEVLDTYVHEPGRPLEMPISAWIGAADASVTRGEADAWREHSSVGFSLHTVPGGHYFHRDSRDALVSAIGRILAAA